MYIWTHEGSPFQHIDSFLLSSLRSIHSTINKENKRFSSSWKYPSALKILIHYGTTFESTKKALWAHLGLPTGFNSLMTHFGIRTSLRFTPLRETRGTDLPYFAHRDAEALKSSPTPPQPWVPPVNKSAVEADGISALAPQTKLRSRRLGRSAGRQRKGRD